MKFIILSLVTVIATLTGSAIDGTSFSCTGGLGGSTPAVAQLFVEQTTGHSVTVNLQLKNRALPDGVTATLEGIFHEASQTIHAEGRIDGNPGSVRITFGQHGQVYLSLYTSHNRRIENGYGAHFRCLSL